MDSITLTPSALNAELNLWSSDGKIQFEKDKEAARQFFLQHVNPNTVFFHDHEEQLEYLVENGYYEPEFLDKYSKEFINNAYKHAYAYKFRFETYMGAYKYYTSYTLKTFDGERYLERFEDRVVAVSLYLAQGDESLAIDYIDQIITGRYQPATPTFLNAGKKQRGELVSCFLIRTEDNLESIARTITSTMQLSKRGGGVGVLLTNIREEGAPIKNIQGIGSGIVPFMKVLEDSASWINQLGARQGACAVYLNAHHPDIMKFLDTKRENADEKIRIKTLSLGVVIPDITFELARNNEEMYLFSPYDVERVYGKPFSDISVTEKYREMIENPAIRKKKISAREFFKVLAEVQMESGYPYIMFEDSVNNANPIAGRINMSNLCVAPETQVLTDKGQLEIATLVGQTVNVWNGEEFSSVKVEKTGENQPLLRVALNNGATIDATEYHKWYIQRGYKKGTGPLKLHVEELRTSELKPGDRLIKFDLPVLPSGQEDFPLAYTAGFFTAEGTYGGKHKDKPKVYLYGEKKYLLPHLQTLSGSGVVDASDRLTYMLPSGIPAKFTVPHNYSIKSKLEWLAGLIDGDGTGSGVKGVQIGSVRPEFLNEVRLMLQTLGVNSRVNFGNKGGLRKFKPNQKEYEAKDGYRLLISGYEVQKLLVLGLKTHRVVLEPHNHDRAASHLVKVVSVENHGRISDTYCFTEPKRRMGVFNGVLTGNCSEILQINSPSSFNEDGSYSEIGEDISCNLGSLNIAKTMDSPAIGHTIETAIRALTAVSDLSSIGSVPSIKKANDDGHSIGLGQMNLHGFLGRERIHYGSEEALDFVSTYFALVAYHAIRASNRIAIERGQKFKGFENSKYATGAYFKKYLDRSWAPKTEKVRKIFEDRDIRIPNQDDWFDLSLSVREYGIYNRYLQAIPPTGSISYINNSTSSVHPIVSRVEIRKEGRLGRVYYPAPYLTNDNLEYYEDAYDIGPEKLIDTYAAAQEHVDQGMSLTLFFKDTVTTRDINKAQIYAWKKGIKTLYYIRLRQMALEGTDVKECVSCSL